MSANIITLGARRARDTPQAYPGEGLVFEQFKRLKVRYCLLRIEEPLQNRSGLPEVDLLVDKEHVPLVENVLGMNGFVPLPSWGNAPHSFFLRLDPSNERWVKFDVVTDIRYGQPIRALSAGLAENCLRHRRRQGSVHVLAAENELIKLLLHCVVHARIFEAQDRERLETLCRELEADPDGLEGAVQLFERCLAPAISWNLFQWALETQNWNWLLQRRHAVIWHLFWREPLRTTGRYLSGRLLRLLRPLLIAARWPGVSVALIGPDGAGKTTLARQLANDPFLRARIIYMGTNPQASTVCLPVSRALQRWAQGWNGERHALLRVLLRAISFAVRLVDQWFRYAVARYHRRCGRVVVFDRFTYDSTWASQIVPDGRPLRRWLLHAGHPRPDLLIFLDAPSEILQARKNEHPLEWIERQRETYLRLRERLPELIVLDTTQGVDRVRRKVIGLLWLRYQLRARLPPVECESRDLDLHPVDHGPLLGL